MTVHKARQDTLRLLDLCTQAVNDKDEPLLPLRGHFFHRALNGLWACANGACAGRRQTPLEDPRWAFGKVFLERRQHCDACGSPVYELVQCGECSAEHLSAMEVMEKGLTGCNHACTTRMRTSSSRNWSLSRKTRQRMKHQRQQHRVAGSPACW